MQLKANFLLKLVFCGLLGAVCSLSFAPFSLWPFAIVAQTGLIFLIHPLKPFRTFLCLWSFWIAHFITSMYWVYVGLAKLLGLNSYVAVSWTCVIGLFYSLLLLMPWLIFVLARPGSCLRLALFPAAWIASEWLQYWLLGGLVWILSGTNAQTIWLSGWIPVFGVLGGSFAFCCTAIFLYQLIFQRRYIFGFGGLTAVWITGLLLSLLSWTKPLHSEIPLRIVQPDAKEWLEREFSQEELYAIWNQEVQQLSSGAWREGLLIWPERGVRSIPDNHNTLMQDLEDIANLSSTALITGANLYSNTSMEALAYNSIYGLGQASGLYQKQKLAPIGERDPLAGMNTVFGNNSREYPSLSEVSPELVSFTHMGNSFLAAGFICYEVAWGKYLRTYAAEANILINLSNDRWFNDSAQLEQALKIAQVRALEHQKPLLRSAFGGISAHIDYRGNIVLRTPDSSATIIDSQIQPRQGQTPYSRFGDLPILLLSLLAPIWVFFRHRET